MKARTPSKDQGQSQYMLYTKVDMLVNDKDYLMHGLKLASLCRIWLVYVSLSLCSCTDTETVLQDKLKCSNTGVHTRNKVSTGVWM